MGSLPIEFLEPRRPAQTQNVLAIPAQSLRRWARGIEPQALDRADQGGLIGKGKLRRKARKLVIRNGIAEQHADAAAVLRAFHIDCGIADEPDVLARGNAARRQREMHRLAGRLVGGGIAGADNAAEESGAAEPLDLTAQQQAGLVADHPEKDLLSSERMQHGFAPGQRRQPLEMDFPKPVEVDRLRFPPALPEMHREALAQAEPHAGPRVVERPFGLAHRAHDKIERLVNGRPAVDERVVPIKQDCPRARDWRRADRKWRDGHAPTCARYPSRNLRLSGPGLPSATGSPSIRTIGNSSAVVLVRKASRAAFASATLNGRSANR